MSRWIDANEFLADESEAYMKAQIALAKRNADKTIDATRYINQVVHKKILMLISDTPTIKTKQIKYYDEDEKVWKIGEVIVDETDE